MKLTKHSTTREIEKAVSEATLARTVASQGETSWPFACGVLESVIVQMARNSPKALQVLNEFLANTPAACARAA